MKIVVPLQIKGEVAVFISTQVKLMRAIRADAALSRLPVYLLTADVEARNQAEASGFTGILLKPITLEKLQALFS